MGTAGRTLARLLLAAIAIVAALLVVNRGSLAPVSAVLPGDCTVGLYGAAVSVEVRGIGASADCKELARRVTDGGTWYVYDSSTTPGGAVICQQQTNGKTYTVRDQGIANIYGHELCSSVTGIAP